jgi:hypothetical protein
MDIHISDVSYGIHISDVSYGIQSDVIHFHIKIDGMVDKTVEMDAQRWAILLDELCGLEKGPDDPK